jgi:serine/threonine protein kinase
MGAVYLAEDRRAFDRLCVIKQMLDYYDLMNPDERLRAQQRFQEEGRTLASLNHPGVPKIYAFFSENGRFYIVMEYIQGENLESRVTHVDEKGQVSPGRRLPQEEVIRYAIQVCGILEYLHSQPRPVVHQDIKPANLILESHLGYVRLVDFGTARVEIPAGSGPGNGRKASIYGTDGYAPPEQYRGKPEPRSDVFALAATAYHLLTDDDPGKHPFKWPMLSALPREVSLALQRALRPSPEQRCSAHELCEALESIATPRRALETFTFPGGVQIRSVLGLPALCDEHWDAARSFLYNGDFQRWLRDINRHDLVLAADDLVKQQPNHDAGLESFLHVVDFGLATPKLVVDPQAVDLGRIARESALVRRVTVLNVTRGYAMATVSATQPWLEVFPGALHLWVGKPVDIRINVRAEGLPFRKQQRGDVRVEAPGLDPIDIPVTAQVSLRREAWRLLWRAVSASIPESWRTLKAGGRLIGRVTRAIGRPFVLHTWLIWAVWFVLGTAIGAGLYYLPQEVWPENLMLLGLALPRPDTILNIALYSVLGLPTLFALCWTAFVVVSIVGGAVLGAVRGAWKSFFR